MTKKKCIYLYKRIHLVGNFRRNCVEQKKVCNPREMCIHIKKVPKDAFPDDIDIYPFLMLRILVKNMML